MNPPTLSTVKDIGCRSQNRHDVYIYKKQNKTYAGTPSDGISRHKVCVLGDGGISWQALHKHAEQLTHK